MPKPICIIYLPTDFNLPGISSPTHLAYALNGWEYKTEQRPEIKEYLWFCFTKEGITAPEFQVFHEKDFTEIQYNELKELIINELKNK